MYVRVCARVFILNDDKRANVCGRRTLAAKTKILIRACMRVYVWGDGVHVYVCMYVDKNAIILLFIITFPCFRLLLTMPLTEWFRGWSSSSDQPPERNDSDVVSDSLMMEMDFQLKELEENRREKELVSISAINELLSLYYRFRTQVKLNRNRVTK